LSALKVRISKVCVKYSMLVRHNMYSFVNLTHNLEGYKADPKLVLLVKLVHTIMKALESSLFMEAI